MTAKTVLIVAAHPDDEVLGCGGTMARRVEDGDQVHVVFMSAIRQHSRPVKYSAHKRRSS